MADDSLLGPGKAQGRALVALIAILAVPLALAAWLNEWRFYAFPLGTLLVALGVPFGLIAVAAIAPRSVEDETPET